MAVTLTGTAGPAYALPSEEVDIDVESAKVDIEPEFTKYKTNALGAINNRAQGAMKLSLSLSGKTMAKKSGAPHTGCALLSALGTAFVPVNTFTTLAGTTPVTAIWGAPTSGLYLLKGSLDYSESDYVGFSLDYEAIAGIA